MRIPGDISKIAGIYGTQKSVGKVERKNSIYSKKDVLFISNEAKDYQTVYRALKGVPDVRQDRVVEILQSMEAGNYNIAGREVADKIIKSIFDKRV